MKCPHCGKDGLVRLQHDRHDDDVFQCVYCDYRHDLTTSASEEELGFWQIFFALAITLLVALPLAGLL
jgi:transcription elongation factor Elf1